MKSVVSKINSKWFEEMFDALWYDTNITFFSIIRWYFISADFNKYFKIKLIVNEEQKLIIL